MNAPSLQRCLETLEKNYHELASLTQNRFLSLEDELSAARFEIISQSALLSQLREENSRLTQENARLQTNISKLQEENDRLQKTALDLDIQINSERDLDRSTQEELELTLLQLHQVQEELEHYFLQTRDLQSQLNRQSSKLSWLRGQRELLIRMLHLQEQGLTHFGTLAARLASSKELEARLFRPGKSGISTRSK